MTDVEYLRQFIDIASQAPLLAVDTETSGLEHIRDGRDYLIGISIACRAPGLPGLYTAYFPFRHNVEQHDNLNPHEFRSYLQTLLKTKPLVFHNRKFDLHSLKTFGITDLCEYQYDTLMEAQLVNEEWHSKKLDSLAKMLLNDSKVDELSDFAKAFGWANVPPRLMDSYARKDAELTYKLHELLWERMGKQELLDLWPCERDFTTALFNMEQAGVGVDLDFCESKAEYGRSRMGSIERELGFNPGSGTELGKFFFDELNLPVLARSEKTGKPSLTKEVLEEYDGLLAVSNTPAARLVLEYRGWQKAVSSLYEPMLRLVSPDGRVRANFNQHGTKTGRLSSNNPNLQQIPRKSENPWNGDAKLAFHAGDPDFELWGWDYAQLEFRLATAYGRDEWLVNEFASPEADVFTAMSERIGAPRQTCKTFTYANLYGAGLAKIAYTLRKPEYEVEDLYNTFLDSIVGIKSASRRANTLARQRGYVRYWTGRRRHFMDRENDSRKAFNSVLQGGAAELVKRTQLRLRELESEDAYMVLQVHDEIVWAIRKGVKEKIELDIEHAMTDWNEFGVRLSVESKRWNEVPLQSLDKELLSA